MSLFASLHPPPHPSPRLPIEILEYIVDRIALDWDQSDPPVFWTLADVPTMLAACSLVHRALIPRCRLHLFETVTLRSQQDLTSLVTTLRKFPQFVKRVRHLDIDATSTESQSWVSTVPLSLPITSMDLDSFSLTGVDLTLVHSTFYMACSRFHEVKNIFFQDVRFTRYSQVTRLVRVTKATHFMWNVKVEDEVLHAPVQPRGRVSLPKTGQVSWFMPWGLLETIMQSFLYEEFTAWPRQLLVLAHGPSRDIPRAIYVAVLQHIMQVYERISYISRESAVVFASGPFILELSGE